jgi:hypothetical protein
LLIRHTDPAPLSSISLSARPSIAAGRAGGPRLVTPQKSRYIPREMKPMRQASAFLLTVSVPLAGLLLRPGR